MTHSPPNQPEPSLFDFLETQDAAPIPDADASQARAAVPASTNPTPTTQTTAPQSVNDAAVDHADDSEIIETSGLLDLQSPDTHPTTNTGQEAQTVWSTPQALSVSPAMLSPEQQANHTPVTPVESSAAAPAEELAPRAEVSSATHEIENVELSEPAVDEVFETAAAESDTVSRTPEPELQLNDPSRVPKQSTHHVAVLRPPAHTPIQFDTSRSVRRVLWVGRTLICIITLALCGLLYRVGQLQINPGEGISKLKNSQKTTINIPARRGTLWDRQGRVMRTTHMAFKLFVDPKSIDNNGKFAEQVGYELGMDPAKLERAIDQHADKEYFVIDRRASDERLDKAVSLSKLHGLGVDPYLIREYPIGALASNVLGFVGSEGKGLDGLERVFDKELTGQQGHVTFFRDVRHRAVWTDEKDYASATDGKSIRLSMDLMIQEIAESELAAACKEFGAKQGELIVMSPATGEILAMANYPSFDPNHITDAKADQWRNRCVTDVYEPGSTFKPYVWSFATEWGIARPTEMINCFGGYYVSPGGRHLRDAHGYGMLSWEEVLVKSSNIGMAQIGLRMGNKRLYHAIKSFGFGKMSGSGLPGEVRGIVNPLNQWNPIFSPTSVPMGQEVAVTPIQMVRAFCTLANGGLAIAPSIRARDASDVSHTAPIMERIISNRTALITKAAMRRVVTEGTGKLANSPYYELFGKTGTAQIPDKKHGGYLPGAYVGSFVCAAPLDDPQVAVVCVIHQPEKSRGYYGGIVAAPAAKRVVEQTLLYMGIPAQTGEEETDVAPPKLVRH